MSEREITKWLPKREGRKCIIFQSSKREREREKICSLTVLYEDALALAAAQKRTAGRRNGNGAEREIEKNEWPGNNEDSKRERARESERVLGFHLLDESINRLM